MTRTRVPNHSVARRVALASMTVLAASGIGLVAAPMAFGQIIIPIGGPLLGSTQNATVTNSGSASANSGGNTAIGNGSSNTATGTAPASAGAVSLPVSLGAPTNTSQGSATITSGAANAVGNSSATSAGQSNASGNAVNGFLGGGQSQSQSAGVTNAGSASANSGGNTAIGNGSTNNASVTQNVTGGLVGVGVNLGGPTNNSTGSATVNSGAANAVGNNSNSTIGQASQGGGGGGVLQSVRPGPGGGGIGGAIGSGPCGSGRFVSFQDVAVRNEGLAQANTGNNVAIGNTSTNNASTAVTDQSVTGGLAGVGLTIGGPVNNSSGTAVITTGPATAVGNNSVTDVVQVRDACPEVATLTAGRRVVVAPKAVSGTLARTGLDTGDLGMIAGALLGGGILLLASQRRRIVARSAAVPLAGLGFGLGGDDWDRAVR